MGIQEVLNEEGYYLDIDAPLPEPRDIAMPGGQTLAHVELLIEDPIREIIVCVPDEGIAMEGIDSRVAGRAVHQQNRDKTAAAEAICPSLHRFLRVELTNALLSICTS
jgi:hypothetical protein